jgi:hypothetical protein
MLAGDADAPWGVRKSRAPIEPPEIKDEHELDHPACSAEQMS